MLSIRASHPFQGPIQQFALSSLALGAVLLALAAGLAHAEALRGDAADAQVRLLVNQLAEDRLTPARHLAQQHLEEAGPAAIEPLIAALRSSDVQLRRNAAEMLGYIASRRALEALVEVLAADPEPTVRGRAAWALGELRDARAVAALERAAVHDSDPLVRREAMESLRTLLVHVASAPWQVPFVRSRADPYAQSYGPPWILQSQKGVLYERHA